MGRGGRRQFLVAAGALLAALLARAQAAGVRILVAVLIDAKEGSNATVWKAFRDRLLELGYVAGKNLVIETRYSQGRRERLPVLAAELVTLNPDVIVVGTTPATRAAMKATATIPNLLRADRVIE